MEQYYRIVAIDMDTQEKFVYHKTKTRTFLGNFVEYGTKVGNVYTTENKALAQIKSFIEDVFNPKTLTFGIEKIKVIADDSQT